VKLDIMAEPSSPAPPPVPLAKESAPPPVRPTSFEPLSRQEVVNMLDSIPTFNLVTERDNRIVGVPDSKGEECIRWYLDVDEANSALVLAQTLKPDVPLRLSVTSLGTAFALCSKWQDCPSSLPLRLQASRAVVAAVAEELGATSGDAGDAFPLFCCDALSNSRVMPFFLTREDLKDTWVGAGRPVERLPSDLTVTLLHQVVQLMRTDTSTNWRAAMFVASPAAIEKAQEIQEATQEAAKIAAADPLDEPPPLE
jgi:hypothetical protein